MSEGKEGKGREEQGRESKSIGRRGRDIEGGEGEREREGV